MNLNMADWKSCAGMLSLSALPSSHIILSRQMLSLLGCLYVRCHLEVNVHNLKASADLCWCPKWWYIKGLLTTSLGGTSFAQNCGEINEEDSFVIVLYSVRKKEWLWIINLRRPHKMTGTFRRECINYTNTNVLYSIWVKRDRIEKDLVRKFKIQF